MAMLDFSSLEVCRGYVKLAAKGVNDSIESKSCECKGMEDSSESS